MFNNIPHRFSVLFIIFSLIGLLASFILTLDKMHLLANPDYIAPCTVSPYIDCTGVMKSWQANLFGFPNTLLGIMGYSATLMVGIFVYFHNVIDRNFLKLIMVGTLGSFLFSLWLMFQSIFSIGALCPYCLLSFVSATVLFAASVAKNFSPNEKDIDNVVFATIGWFILIIFLIYFKYGNALFTLS